jgi:imidazolonepropionase-like amidohydrolase
MRGPSNATIQQFNPMMSPSRRSFLVASAASFATLGLPASLKAQTTAPALPVLFTNVRLFDGTSEALSGPMNVLVAGNKITALAADELMPPVGVQPMRIDGNGRTLMPGLIDAHTHMAMSVVPMSVTMTADPYYTMLRQGQAAGEMLMRGFTSARDLAGPTFGLKRAIDEGYISGPRIWPSGAALSQTSGHADYRTLFDLPRITGEPLHFTERVGFAAIADGPEEVLRRAREQLMLGASQIKLMAGGGVTSDHDPLDVTQYTEAEIRAAVEAAENWGTYVTVHAYTPRAIQQAIRAGVKCIDHGQLADAETARIIADKGIWWSLQPFLGDEDDTPFPEGSANRAKQLEVSRGTENAYAFAKQLGIKTAFGTDTLFDEKVASRQGAQLAKLTRWYTPAQVLKMATADNGELLALSGLRTPYPGKLGVIEEGALADLIMVDGDPIADIQLIADPEKNFLVIMKDGKLFKNTLSPNAELARR